MMLKQLKWNGAEDEENNSKCDFLTSGEKNCVLCEMIEIYCLNMPYDHTQSKREQVAHL